MPIALLAAHRAAGALPDTLQVGGRCAVADASALRLLVSVADEAEARRMPAHIERDGKTWNVETTLLPIVSLHHDVLNAKNGDGEAACFHEEQRRRRAWHFQEQRRGSGLPS